MIEAPRNCSMSRPFYIFSWIIHVWRINRTVLHKGENERRKGPNHTQPESNPSLQLSMRQENHGVSTKNLIESNVKLSGGPNLLDHDGVSSAVHKQNTTHRPCSKSLACGVRHDERTRTSKSIHSRYALMHSSVLIVKTHRCLPRAHSRLFSTVSGEGKETPETENKHNLEACTPPDINITDSKVLYEKVIDLDNLKAGLKRLRAGASPGLDGETKENLTEKKLVRLNSSLKAQRYQPKPNKRIPIPKPGGGERKLGIANGIDKVVQGSLLNLLEPVLEPVFLNCSYGYRPGRGCHDALHDIRFR